ncbi:MAG: hypothetical protein KBT22_08650 [Bacteroidales bacterium]|nr:hypothetical protein [Candidatus Scybalocola fimicaballi]
MRIIEKLLLCVLTFFCLSACKEDPEEEIVPETVERTIIMFFPWSNNLKPCFIQNINDFKQVIRQYGLENERYVVCIENNPGIVDIIELRPFSGNCLEENVEHYFDPNFTNSDGIADLLDRVYAKYPSHSYSMTVGCHGTAWVAAGAFTTRSAALTLDEVPQTRYIGGTSSVYQIEISTLRRGIQKSKIQKFDMILFDNCYMSSIEVAYELKDVCSHIVAYPTEVMAYGFPYQISGKYLIGGNDYENICESFYRFYLNYEKPCGTISAINCVALDTLARFMKKLNQSVDTTVHVDVMSLQRFDGYDPVLFVDYSDYVYHLTDDTMMLGEFENLMSVLIPYKRNTPNYFSTLGGLTPIEKYSGISTSEPCEHPAMSTYKQTSWYIATH